ncbi:MAG: ACP S-malonyltransferase [Chitinophagales bacterium]|nr:ACP S-malonyltransferase [Chitinophagales bacterium]
MTAYVFPGQGSQFSGMGKDLWESSETARNMFSRANELLGFPITNIMFEGTDEELKQTKVTQPAVFLHSVIAYTLLQNPQPAMVAGHSLGEFSALVANGTLAFEEALQLVLVRAFAMQKACELVPSTMAAVVGYQSEAQVEEICRQITNEVVVPANYNSPGQLVISGSINGIDRAIELLKAAGVRRAIKLPVGGAFHSPLMEPARKELAEAINKAGFKTPVCPIYQNVSAKAETEPEVIKQNLIAQLTAPVKWTQSVLQMKADGATEFKETGPGNVLTGLIGKIIG